MCLLCVEMAKMHIKEVASAYIETDMVTDHFDEFLDLIEKRFGKDARLEFADLVAEKILESPAYND